MWYGHAVRTLRPYRCSLKLLIFFVQFFVVEVEDPKLVRLSRRVTVVLPVEVTHLVHDACMFIKCTRGVQGTWAHCYADLVMISKEYEVL